MMTRKILALVAVLSIGVVTLTNAQDPNMGLERKIALEESRLETLKALLQANKEILASDDIRIPPSVIGQAVDNDPRLQQMETQRLALEQAIETRAARSAEDDPQLEVYRARLKNFENSTANLRKTLLPQVEAALKREIKVKREQEVQEQEIMVQAQTLLLDSLRQQAQIVLAEQRRAEARIKQENQLPQTPAKLPVAREAATKKDEATIKIFTLENADVRSMADIAQSLFGRGTSPPIRMSIDDRTNSLIVLAPDDDLAILETMLMKLDSIPPAEKNEERVVKAYPLPLEPQMTLVFVRTVVPSAHIAVDGKLLFVLASQAEQDKVRKMIDQIAEAKKAAE